MRLRLTKLAGLLSRLFHKEKSKPYLVAMEDIRSDNLRIDLSARDYYCQLLQSGGMIKPVILKRIPGSSKYECIDGHTRILAYKKLGLKQIPAVFSQTAIRTVYLSGTPIAPKTEEPTIKCPKLNFAETFVSN